jgi:hypothetical protein
MNLDNRPQLIDKLQKLMERADFSAPSVVPSGNCKDVTTHLCGMFLKTHSRAILEALRRMD